MKETSVPQSTVGKKKRRCFGTRPRNFIIMLAEEGHLMNKTLNWNAQHC